MAKKKRASSLLKDVRLQPKSDYTYSESLTYRNRVTPDRKIGSPNMSRRGLRGVEADYVKSPDFSAPDLSFDSSHLSLRTRTILRPMDTLSDTSDGEEVQEQITFPRRTRSSRSRSIDVIPKINGSAVTKTFTTTSFTTTRTLHRGLDTESDVDDGSESTVPLRATPLTARSGTPLGRAGTPVNKPLLKKTSLDTSRGGYTLAKGAIAEDLEEEEKTKIVSWTKKTWQNINRITTLITTSFVMMAARAVTSTDSDSSDVSSSQKSARYSILSTIDTTRRKITKTTTEFLESTKVRLKKNPILLWIPLLFILLILALVGYYNPQGQHDKHLSANVSEVGNNSMFP